MISLKYFYNNLLELDITNKILTGCDTRAE